MTWQIIFTAVFLQASPAALDQFRGHPFGTPKEQILGAEKDKLCQEVTPERKGTTQVLCFTMLYYKQTPFTMIFKLEAGNPLIEGWYEYPLWLGEDTFKEGSRGGQILTTLIGKYGEPTSQGAERFLWTSEVGILRMELKRLEKSNHLEIRYQPTNR